MPVSLYLIVSLILYMPLSLSLGLFLGISNRLLSFSRSVSPQARSKEQEFL